MIHLASRQKAKTHEACVYGLIYFNTKSENAEEALAEFKKKAQKAGFNADNVVKCTVFDEDGNTELDVYEAY